MSDAKSRIRNLKRIGGALCLDFANTTGWRPEPGDEELLRDYEDLVVWAGHVGALVPGESRDLLDAAAAAPEKAATTHRRAIALREAIHRIFSAMAAEHHAASGDIAVLNRAVDDAHRHLRLVASKSGFAWAWHGRDSLEYPLWQIARSAAGLLVSPDVERLRECAGERCDWLFLDESRNRSRRWCDMANCGNRAKARRNYARRKGAASS